MMTHIDSGITGAKRQSWRHDNPRDTLRNIIEGNPRAGKDELFELFKDVVLKTRNHAMFETIIEYWFANNLTSLLQGNAELKKQFSGPNVAKIKDKIRERIKIASGFVLLDMIMPNNKRLGDCTGAECAAVGGWLSIVAARMSPSQIVGKVFDEKDIHEMLEYEARR